MNNEDLNLPQDIEKSIKEFDLINRKRLRKNKIITSKLDLFVIYTTLGFY